MADVRLLYPLEKLEAASRLADALAAAGYSVDRQVLADSLVFPAVAAEAGKAKVLLLIWSRSLVSAATAAGRLAEARRQPNLVEISADGIEPVSDAEGSPVVLLCGWRGQPFHPGWQRILAQTQRLCGGRDGAAKGVAPKPRAAAAAERGASVRRRPMLAAAIAAGAAIAVTVGAAATLDRGGPDAAPRTESRSAPASSPAPAAFAAQAPAASSALPAGKAAAPPAPDDPVIAVGPGPEAPGAGAVESRPVPAAAAVRRPAAARSGPKRLAAVADREVKRYSRKNSKTMRLFCQRSGRSTPQCRTFARSARHLRG